MKTISILATLLLVAAVAVAGTMQGPAGKVITATTSGVGYTLQDSTSNPTTRITYVLCEDDAMDVQVLLWSDGVYITPSFGTNMAGADSTFYVAANEIVPIMGKYHRLVFTTETGDADVSIKSYTE